MGSIGKDFRLAAPALSTAADSLSDDWLGVPVMEREILLDMLALAVLVEMKPAFGSSYPAAA